MNIFDPIISGSLIVSGSAEFTGDLTVVGTINATISGTTSNAISASEADNAQLLDGKDSSEFATTSSYTTGSYTGSFKGDGSLLFGIPAGAVIGLNLSKISDGASEAKITSADGLRINNDTEITGSLIVTNDVIINGTSYTAATSGTSGTSGTS